MTFFSVTYRYITDADAVSARRPEHRDYMIGLADAGRLMIGGPYVDGPAGALLVYEAPDEDAVRELTAADPFVRAGMVETVTIRRWKPVIGLRVEQF